MEFHSLPFFSALLKVEDREEVIELSSFSLFSASFWDPEDHGGHRMTVYCLLSSWRCGVVCWIGLRRRELASLYVCVVGELL